MGDLNVCYAWMLTTAILLLWNVKCFGGYGCIEYSLKQILMHNGTCGVTMLERFITKLPSSCSSGEPTSSPPSIKHDLPISHPPFHHMCTLDVRNENILSVSSIQITQPNNEWTPVRNWLNLHYKRGFVLTWGLEKCWWGLLNNKQGNMNAANTNVW